MTMLNALVVLVAAVPLTAVGGCFARKDRNTDVAQASILLMFGVNFFVDPPGDEAAPSSRDRDRGVGGQPATRPSRSRLHVQPAGSGGRVVLEQAALDDLRRAEMRRRLMLLTDAVEAASQELYAGNLSFRDGETLAREITSVRTQIAALRRELVQDPR